jgi:hypothetical protein
VACLIFLLGSFKSRYDQNFPILAKLVPHQECASSFKDRNGRSALVFSGTLHQVVMCLL